MERKAMEGKERGLKGTKGKEWRGYERRQQRKNVQRI